MSTLLTSCDLKSIVKRSYTPEESMKVYVDATVMRENADTVDFIGSEEEKESLYIKGKIKIKNIIIDELKNQGVNVSDNQIEKIYKAILKAINKINFRIEKVSEQQNSAEVKVIYNPLDFSNVESAIEQYAQEESKGAVLRDEDDVKDIAINALIRYYEEVNVSSDICESTFKMHKEGKKWVLDDEEAFKKEIEERCISDGNKVSE